jgi:hypothetical protein
MAVGDVTGDGYQDFVIGTPYDTSGAKLMPGPPPLGVYTWDTLDAIHIQIEEEYTVGGGRMGRPGDVDGDGFEDLLPGPYLFLGPIEEDLTIETVFKRFTGNSGLHSTTTNGGDVNGDGRSDILIGCHSGITDGLGEVYLFYDASSAVGETYALDEADAIITGSLPYDPDTKWPGALEGLGQDVAHVGDANGDGFGDILTSFSYGDDGSYRYTWAYFEGPLAGNYRRTDADAVIHVGTINTWTRAHGRADLNGDGYDDVLLPDSAGYHDNRAFVFFGPLESPGLEAEDAEIVIGSSNGTIYDIAPGGDIDAGGAQDLLIACREPPSPDSELLYGQFWVFLGPSPGVYEYSDADIAYRFDDSNHPLSLSIAEDFDGGGAPDILISKNQSGIGSILLYLGEGL